MQEARVNLDKDLLRLEEEKKESVSKPRSIVSAVWVYRRKRRSGHHRRRVWRGRARPLEAEKEVTAAPATTGRGGDMSAERARRVLNIEAEARAQRIKSATLLPRRLRCAPEES